MTASSLILHIARFQRALYDRKKIEFSKKKTIFREDANKTVSNGKLCIATQKFRYFFNCKLQAWRFSRKPENLIGLIRGSFEILNRDANKMSELRTEWRQFGKNCMIWEILAFSWIVHKMEAFDRTLFKRNPRSRLREKRLWRKKWR